MRFQDKVVIVTGAASGMGLLSSQQYAREGAKVVLTDVNAEAATAAAESISKCGGEAIGMAVDVSNYADVEKAVASTLEHYGRIDVVLNSAGGSPLRICRCEGGFDQMDLSALDWGVDVNFRGPIYFSRAALPIMIKQKGGVIINMGSVDGVTGTSGDLVYSACKSGMIGLTKSLALYGAPHGVRACCVSPGPVLTRAAMANMKTPLGRAAEPEEVTSLILYLSSDEAAFITGTNYSIDGGRSCGGRD
ncbi:SDR family oxidoreductase [Ruficoccus sp. ZRK36]|uniref:SDR family NAD(P)-dependent oxidoreductase n=1 Tax=Ruficoccus sp. ZRK36 TaxID=2866311 RepID=UPI001C739D01|nr:SDR family oxidoreductase [Ruficoccus sp. ZRK36]QYY35647.1 SDR family oxidoreductase [Ruficoccus sp. ZRK36]